MKGLITLSAALTLLGAASIFAPSEETLNPPLAQDLSTPSTSLVRTTVTLSQQWIARQGKMQAYGYTPQGEAVTVFIDDETKRPARMGALSSYEVTGYALGNHKLQAKELKLVKQIPEPIDTIRLSFDQTPTYDRQIGRWQVYSATLNGQDVQLKSQLTVPQQTVVGYWKGDAFIVIR